MVNLRGDNAKKGLRLRLFFKQLASPRSAERVIRCPDAIPRLTAIQNHVGSQASCMYRPRPAGLGRMPLLPCDFNGEEGGVRSVSVSRLSILGIKTGRGIGGHTTRGRKEGRNTFIPFPQVEVEWVSRKKKVAMQRQGMEASAH